MWPFRRSASNTELLERVESLERRFKTLLADVDEYFHLVRRAENRMKKKAELESEQSTSTAGESDGTVPVMKDGSAGSHLLTPRQMQIQQMILRRRAGIQ